MSNPRSPETLLANYIKEHPVLDHQLRAGVRRATTPAAAARWLKRRILFHMRPGRALAPYRLSAKKQGLRAHHVDWGKLVADFSYLSVHEFIDLLRRGEVDVRRAYLIQRYEIVPRGTRERDDPEAFAFVSINLDEGVLWKDGQAYVADIDDTEIDLEMSRDIEDREELIRAIEDVCTKAERTATTWQQHAPTHS